MFNPGDLVRLSGHALCENIKRNGTLFPGLNEESVMTVIKQTGRTVKLEPGFNVHHSWLVLAIPVDMSSDNETILS